MIGQTLGHYRMLEQIGAGGMGLVFRAHDERLDRDVALKVLPPGTLGDENARRRFRKEALTLSKLNHPNIETVFDFDTQDGVDFLVMELIPGATLDQKLAAGPLAEKELLRLGQQLAEGLAAAHAESVVHRDLKPGNLRLMPDGRLKILDFGLAKLLGPVSDAAVTESLSKTHGPVGTLPYMAPEQLRGEKADVRSDIWAAGAVLYEMATGRRPFPQSSYPMLTDAILREAPVSPRAVNANLSPELERILTKALEKDPEHRYQSARELGADLRRLAAPPTAVPATKPVPGRRRYQWYALAAGGLVVTLLVMGMVVPHWEWRDRLVGKRGANHIESLAVLPLKNLSNDPDQEYFADGMTEALIAELSQIRALKVISRTSVMQYKGAKKPMPEIARELGVDGVIEGSVLREGDQVRITVQLIHGPTDRHLWARSFDRELRGILALHSDVAQAIAAEIKVKLTPQEQTRLASARPVNPEAYDAYLRGRGHWYKFTPEGFDTALHYFQLALEKDPNLVPALVGIGDVWIGRAHIGLLPPREGWPKGRTAALKALELDDTSVEAHELLAIVLTWYDWDWVAGEREFRRAIELNPNYARVRSFYGYFLAAMGRPQEARTQMDRALELDPYNSFFQMALGQLLVFERRYDEAIAQFRKADRMQPDSLFTHAGFWHAFHQKGEHGEALAEAKEYFALLGDREVVDVLDRGYGQRGYEGAMRRAAETLAARATRTYVSGYDVATLYSHAGEKERALDWLERAYQQRESRMVYVNVQPWVRDQLRDEPRFQALLKRINFTP